MGVIEDTTVKEKKDGTTVAPEGSSKYTTRTVGLKDGTYGTENVYSGTADEKAAAERVAAVQNVKKTHLKTLLLGGDYLLSAMVGVSMTKLCLKLPQAAAALKNQVLLVLVNLFKLLKDKGSSGEKSDAAVRLTQCIRMMAGNCGSPMEESQMGAAELLKAEWASQQRKDQLAKVVEMANQSSEWAMGNAIEAEEKCVAPDECIVFRQLRERKGGAAIVNAIDDGDDFRAASGSAFGQAAVDGQLFAERLAKVQQMTGLADPVYVEAFLQVHSFDLVLEVLIVNRTQETLQNVLVELNTQGDLKIVDRPSAVTLAPGQQVMTSASIKVSSTETGVIFGYVTFDKASASDKECTALNELHVDILDYIERGWISELAFRTMWSEFEWKNKINTSIAEVGTYLTHIMRNTNMSIVGRSYKKPDKKQEKKLSQEDVEEMFNEAVGIKTLIQTSSFVAVNLYAKSIFGEDALSNISIEKLPDGKLSGSVRIRSRTQGIALSLGDRITVVQRGKK